MSNPFHFQWTKFPRYYDCLYTRGLVTWNDVDISFKYRHTMANGCSVLFKRARHHNVSALLCEFFYLLIFFFRSIEHFFSIFCSFSTTARVKKSSKNNLKSIPIISIRFPKHLCGFYQKIELLKPKNHFVGWEVGHLKKKLRKNSKSSSVTVSVISHAMLALNKTKSVRIHYQRGPKNSANLSANKRSSRSSLWWHCLSSERSRAFSAWDRKMTRKKSTFHFFISIFFFRFSIFRFIVQVFKAYDSPIAPDQAAAILSVVNNCGNLMFLLLIRFTGKRYLYLSMLTVVFLCSAVICSYGFAILPAGYNSFDKLQYFSLENKTLGYIPFICIILWSFCTFCGVNSMPWQVRRGKLKWPWLYLTWFTFRWFSDDQRNFSVQVSLKMIISLKMDFFLSFLKKTFFLCISETRNWKKKNIFFLNEKN